MVKRITKVTFPLGIVVTLVGLAMMVAVREYRANTSFMQPEPWWIADQLRAGYLLMFFVVGPLLTVWSGVHWALYNYMRSKIDSPR